MPDIRARLHAVAVLLVALMGLCVTLTRAQDEAISVVVDERLGSISPYVYGVNYGPWGLVSMDMANEAARAGVTHMRFPAGRHGDTHGFTRQQLDLYMLQVRAWGGTPSVSVRLEGGTPEQAADMVRYANIEKDYDVRYWSIGNEPDLYVDYDVDRFNTDWRAFAEAMKAVDPDILLMGPEVSQFPPTRAGDPYTNARRDWVRAFLETNGDLVDIVAVHRYPFPTSLNSPSTTAEDLRQNAPEWDVLIENLREVVRDTLDRDLPLAFTEINSHWNHVSGAEGSPDSFYHAIWWADVLGRFIRERVDIVNYFALSSFGALGTFGLLDRYEVRPTYYVYQLYQRFGSELVASSSPNPDVTITAALRDDGVLTLMIVNRGPDSVEIPLDLSGFQPGGSSDVWRFDPEHAAEQLGAEAVADGTVLEIPAMSITLYAVPPGG